MTKIELLCILIAFYIFFLPFKLHHIAIDKVWLTLQNVIVSIFSYSSKMPSRMSTRSVCIGNLSNFSVTIEMCIHYTSKLSTYECNYIIRCWILRRIVYWMFMPSTQAWNRPTINTILSKSRWHRYRIFQWFSITFEQAPSHRYLYR